MWYALDKGEVSTRISWRELREKRTLGRPRRKWEDNIKIYLQERDREA